MSMRRMVHPITALKVRRFSGSGSGGAGDVQEESIGKEVAKNEGRRMRAQA